MESEEVLTARVIGYSSRRLGQKGITVTDVDFHRPAIAIGVQDSLQAKDVRQNNLVIWKRFNYPLSTNNVDSIRDKFNMLNPLMDERLRHAYGHGKAGASQYGRGRDVIPRTKFRPRRVQYS
jgi:hypothetical protein